MGLLFLPLAVFNTSAQPEGMNELVTDKNQLRFSGYDWIIKETEELRGPGPNYFLNSTKNYRKNGNLPHLTAGLSDKNVTILGNGNIGKTVAGMARLPSTVDYGDDSWRCRAKAPRNSPAA